MGAKAQPGLYYPSYRTGWHTYRTGWHTYSTGLEPETSVLFLILFPITEPVHSVAGPAGGALPVSQRAYVSLGLQTADPKRRFDGQSIYWGKHLSGNMRPWCRWRIMERRVGLKWPRQQCCSQENSRVLPRGGPGLPEASPPSDPMTLSHWPRAAVGSVTSAWC